MTLFFGNYKIKKRGKLMNCKPILFVTLCAFALVSCSDGYKKCKTVSIGSATYSSSDVMKYHVAKYQIIGTNPGLRNLFDDGSESGALSFFCFFEFGEKVKKDSEPKFSKEANITVVTSSGNEVLQWMMLLTSMYTLLMLLQHTDVMFRYLTLSE